MTRQYKEAGRALTGMILIYPLWILAPLFEQPLTNPLVEDTWLMQGIDSFIL